MAAAGAVKGAGLIRGYLKGFGYTEYIYRNVAGWAWSLPSVSSGIMTGKYVGHGGMPSPINFIGGGETDFMGAGISLGNWISYDRNNIIFWQGKITGVGISMPIGQIADMIKNAVLKIATNAAGEISGGTIKTNTKILFPQITSDNE
jgi:hypothetical protein